MFKLKNKKRINLKRGFTLVELMVSVSLFAFVALLVGTVVFSANAVNNRLNAQKSVYESINLVLDDMSRELSQGSRYRCLNYPTDDIYTTYNNIYIPRDCASGSGLYGISFRLSDYSNFATPVYYPPSPIPMAVYVLESGRIRRVVGGINVDGSNNVTIHSMGQVMYGGTSDYITDSNITITRFSVTTANTTTYADGDLGQANVQIIIEGKTKTAPIVNFSVQATVTQREPEN